MKNLIVTLSLLLSTYSSYAQKAYDQITYKATIYSNAATLTLADGYLLASEVIIKSKPGNQFFEPNANEPDSKGQLLFKAVKGTGRYKDIKGSWILLSVLAISDLPQKIKAIYWDGKVRKSVIFTATP